MNFPVCRQMREGFSLSGGRGSKVKIVVSYFAICYLIWGALRGYILADLGEKEYIEDRGAFYACSKR